MKHHHKMHKAHKKAGGKVHVDDDMKGEKKQEKEGAAYKHGGKVKHHKKHGGKVDGHKPHHRADKRTRGGNIKAMVKSAAGMSPTSPLSGAGKTKEPKAPHLDKEDD